MKRKLFGSLGLIFGLVAQTANVAAETTTVANGDWHNPSTWSAGVPRAGDTALISHQLTARGNVVCTGAG
jgi:hypothetical protein